jgi:anti-sigma factor RsiW
MRSPCNPELLETLALHEAALPPAEAAAARAHAATCPDCQRELLWLRAERDLLRRRQQALAPMDLDRLFAGVETRLPAPCHARRAPLARYRSALWAAAAVLAAIVMQQGTGLLSSLGGGGGGQQKSRKVQPAEQQATLSVSGPIHLRLQTGAADVEVGTGQPGQLVVKADEAPIRLIQQADRVEAQFGGADRLGSGSVRAVLPPGSKLDLDTLAGDAVVKGALGQIQVRSTSGDLTMEGDDAPSLRFESVSGDLTYTGGCGAGCSMDLRTVSGELDLRLARTSSFDLRYSTQSGDFSDELTGQDGQDGQEGALPAAGIRTRYGKGEGRIQATTVSGGLSLQPH